MEPVAPTTVAAEAAVPSNIAPPHPKSPPTEASDFFGLEIKIDGANSDIIRKETITLLLIAIFIV